MFITKRAQGLHDLAAGSEVRIRNPRAADARDYFVPEESKAGRPFPSPATETCDHCTVYCVPFRPHVSGCWTHSLPECIDQNICTASEDQAGSILGFVMIGGAGIVIGLRVAGSTPWGSPRQTASKGSDARCPRGQSSSSRAKAEYTFAKRVWGMVSFALLPGCSGDVGIYLTP
jgi:hypothetical protein